MRELSKKVVLALQVLRKLHENRNRYARLLEISNGNTWILEGKLEEAEMRVRVHTPRRLAR